jgi:hypothetical protein
VQPREGVSRLNAALRRFGPSLGHQRRHLDRGETDFAAVLERERTAIDNAGRRTARDGFAAARRSTHGLLLRRGAKTSEHDCQIGRNGRGRAPVPPADHQRQGKGGNAALLRQ